VQLTPKVNFRWLPATAQPASQPVIDIQVPFPISPTSPSGLAADGGGQPATPGIPLGLAPRGCRFESLGWGTTAPSPAKQNHPRGVRNRLPPFDRRRGLAVSFWRFFLGFYFYFILLSISHEIALFTSFQPPFLLHLKSYKIRFVIDSPSSH
jgi:hypothetical protein